MRSAFNWVGEGTLSDHHLEKIGTSLKQLNDVGLLFTYRSSKFIGVGSRRLSTSLIANVKAIESRNTPRFIVDNEEVKITLAGDLDRGFLIIPINPGMAGDEDHIYNWLRFRLFRGLSHGRPLSIAKDYSAIYPVYKDGSFLGYFDCGDITIMAFETGSRNSKSIIHSAAEKYNDSYCIEFIKEEVR